MSKELLGLRDSVRPLQPLWQDFRKDNTCLVIIDMQKDFLDEGAPIEVAAGRRVIPEIRKLLEVFRKHGGTVIHIVTRHPADGLTAPRFTTSPTRPGLGPKALLEGTEGALEVEPLRPALGEYTVVKKRYSGFYCTDLEVYLRALGTENMVVCGVCTNYCVRSTVHDAYFRGYKCVLPLEGTGSHTVAEHEASLKDIVVGFGYIATLDEIIQQIESTWSKES